MLGRDRWVLCSVLLLLLRAAVAASAGLTGVDTAADTWSQEKEKEVGSTGGGICHTSCFCNGRLDWSNRAESTMQFMLYLIEWELIDQREEWLRRREGKGGKNKRK